MIPSIPPSSTSGPDTFTREPKRLKKSEHQEKLKHQEKLNPLVGIPLELKTMILEYVGDFIPLLAIHFSFLEPILIVLRKLNGTDPLGCCFSSSCSAGGPEKCAIMQMVKHVAICMEKMNQLSQDAAASSTGANHFYPVVLEKYLERFEKYLQHCKQANQDQANQDQANQDQANQDNAVLKRYLIELGQSVGTLPDWHNFCVNSKRSFFVSVFLKCADSHTRYFTHTRGDLLWIQHLINSLGNLIRLRQIVNDKLPLNLPTDPSTSNSLGQLPPAVKAALHHVNTDTQATTTTEAVIETPAAIKTGVVNTMADAGVDKDGVLVDMCLWEANINPVTAGEYMKIRFLIQEIAHDNNLQPQIRTNLMMQLWTKCIQPSVDLQKVVGHRWCHSMETILKTSSRENPIRIEDTTWETIEAEYRRLDDRDRKKTDPRPDITLLPALQKVYDCMRFLRYGGVFTRSAEETQETAPQTAPPRQHIDLRFFRNMQNCMFFAPRDDYFEPLLIKVIAAAVFAPLVKAAAGAGNRGGNFVEPLVKAAARAEDRGGNFVSLVAAVEAEFKATNTAAAVEATLEEMNATEAAEAGLEAMDVEETAEAGLEAMDVEETG